MICSQRPGVERTWLSQWPMWAAAPVQVASGLFFARRSSQTTVMKPTKKTPTRKKKRHVQARRRLTTSSSRSRFSSVPKRLGQGIRRRTIRSTKPRKPMTTPRVAPIDCQTPSPTWWWNQK
jgi:hypothetical protein